MRILIRSDASGQMGTGHIMRCLALAKGLGKTGNEVAFICRAHGGNLIEKIRLSGFPVHILPLSPAFLPPTDPWLPAHAHWLGATWEEDAEAVSGILRAMSGAVDGLIVDHYGLDAAWESRLRSSVGWIAAIDDLADRPHDCDVLLDQNLYEEPERRYAGLAPRDCRMLLGPEYALLREEFAQARSGPRRSHDGIRRLLVYFGGIDPEDNTSKTLLALDLAGWERKPTDVVIPEGHPRRKDIEGVCARHPGMTLHTNVERMSELMTRADLAIGAGGTSSWERCCLGLPCLAACVADNQSELLRVLHARGALVNLGNGGEVTEGSLARAMKDLEAKPDAMRSMSETAWSLVDGEGAPRVIAALAALPPRTTAPEPARYLNGERPDILLRKSRPGDALLYFRWTNDEETRRNSFDSGPVEWPIHFAWFRSKLADPETRLYVLENGGVPVGQIRFNVADESVVIHFSVDREFRGRGFGTELLERGPAQLHAELLRPLVFIGYVKEANASSAGAFLKAGFERSDPRRTDGADSLVFRKTISGRA